MQLLKKNNTQVFLFAQFSVVRAKFRGDNSERVGLRAPPPPPRQVKLKKAQYSMVALKGHRKS